MRTGLLLLTFALVAVPARAQSTDARWAPWLGCWTLATENLRDGASQDARRTARPSSVDEGAPRVCVTRAADGARFETTVGIQSSIDQTIVADGAARPVTDAECTGTKRAQWSKSGLRLFSSADISCQGEAGQRRVSGLSLIAPNGDWLDIQTVALGSRETISIKRYYRDAAATRSAFPSVASPAFTLAEVKDAAGNVSTAAIEAALVETGAGFNLTAKSLKDLHSGGVPERVIDLIVALSYPEKFVVQRAARGVPSPATIYRDPFGPGWSYGYPYSYNSFYGSPYFYEPFGWRGYSAFGYSMFDSPVVYVVDAGGGSGGSAPDGPGRAVNGQGYTRIVPRQSFADTTVTANRASTSGSSASSSSSGASSSSSGSSGGGSASSSGGYSSGGSGGSSSGSSGGSGSSDSGGRTAVPR